MITLTACSLERTAITGDEFVQKMESAGYEIVNVTGQFEDGLVEVAYIAIKGNYQIEFFVVPTIDQAKAAYNSNKTDFEALGGGSASTKSVAINNYSYFTLTTSQGYHHVSRIDNTFIYVSTDKAHRDEIREILSDLGY